MRLDLRSPLSGDVTQAINPVTWFVRSLGQLGFININLGRTPAPEVEERIVQEVASYGRQIGRVSDALDVLVGRLLKANEEQPETARLSNEELAALFDFRSQLQEIRAVKAAALAERGQ
jgi:hypothetical protein